MGDDDLVYGCTQARSDGLVEAGDSRPLSRGRVRYTAGHRAVKLSLTRGTEFCFCCQTLEWHDNVVVKLPI